MNYKVLQSFCNKELTLKPLPGVLSCLDGEAAAPVAAAWDCTGELSKL